MAVKKITAAISEAWQFFKGRGILGSLKSKDAPWLIQFGKYGFCGVLATVLHNFLFWVFAHHILPAFDETMPTAERAWNWVGDNLLAFAVSNVFVYAMNLAIVFEGGRHGKWKEFLFFTAVNLVAMTPALVLGSLAIMNDKTTPFAQLVFIIAAVMVNFLARKFLVFNR